VTTLVAATPTAVELARPAIADSNEAAPSAPRRSGDSSSEPEQPKDSPLAPGVGSEPARVEALSAPALDGGGFNDDSVTLVMTHNGLRQLAAMRAATPSRKEIVGAPVIEATPLDDSQILAVYERPMATLAFSDSVATQWNASDAESLARGEERRREQAVADRGDVGQATPFKPAKPETGVREESAAIPEPQLTAQTGDAVVVAAGTMGDVSRATNNWRYDRSLGGDVASGASASPRAMGASGRSLSMRTVVVASICSALLASLATAVVVRTPAASGVAAPSTPPAALVVPTSRRTAPETTTAPAAAAGAVVEAPSPTAAADARSVAAANTATPSAAPVQTAPRPPARRVPRRKPRPSVEPAVETATLATGSSSEAPALPAPAATDPAAVPSAAAAAGPSNDPAETSAVEAAPAPSTASEGPSF
jgi:hypothetical protein